MAYPLVPQTDDVRKEYLLRVTRVQTIFCNFGGGTHPLAARNASVTEFGTFARSSETTSTPRSSCSSAQFRGSHVTESEPGSSAMRSIFTFTT